MRRFLMISIFLGMLCFIGGGQAWAEIKMIAHIKAAHCQHPKWSADGTRLAYEVRHVNRHIIEIHIYNWLTGKSDVVRPSSLQSGGLGLGVVVEKKGMVARELAWAPKGYNYLFSSNGTGTVYNVYLSQEGPLKANSPLKNDGQPSWSKNGAYAVFTSGRTGKGDLYLVRMQGTQLQPRRLTTFADSTEFFPVWSPQNNLQLAFVRHTDQSDRIYLINNIFVPKPQRLTRWNKNVSELNPSWSPDGKHIAFFGVSANGVYDLYISTLAGQVKLLAKDIVKGDQFGPAWSPDGKQLFYVQRLEQNRDQIFAVNPSTGAKKPIVTNTHLNSELSVTKRDGNWLLAFTSQGEEKTEGLVYRKLYVKTLKPF